MPRQLKEINNFNLGTILNLSEKDIPEDAAAYSLNVNPLSQNGILNSINSDRFMFSSNNKEIGINTPINWRYYGPYEQLQFTDISKIYLNDLRDFGEKSSVKLSFIGTQGVREKLQITDIQPYMSALQDSGQTNPSIYTWYPPVAITSTSDSFTCLTSTNTITKTGLADGDITVSGFTEGSATITLIDATRTNYDTGTGTSNYFTIVTPDGRSVNYHFSDNHNTSQTGTTATINSVSGVVIGMSDVTESVTAIATNVKNAIENASGHHDRISITQASGVLTLTYLTKELVDEVGVGDFITIVPAGDSLTEIMKITEINRDTNTIFIKRGVFGTALMDVTAGELCVIYSNKVAIDGQFITTHRGIARLSDSGNTANTWSNYSANHLGGNSNYLTYASNDATSELVGAINLEDTNQEVTVDATNKTVTFGSAIDPHDLFAFYEGEYITFYHNQNYSGSNYGLNGFTSKIVKITKSPLVLTLEDTPPAQAELSTGMLYMEANLLKNHTFHHQVTTSSYTVTDSSGDDTNQKYKLNDWEHVALYSTSGDYATNIYGFNNNLEDTDVNVVDSGGYWETSTGNIDLGGTSDLATKFYPFEENDKYVKLINGYHIVNDGNNAATVKGTLTADNNDSTLYITFGTSGIQGIFAKNDILLIGSEYMLVMEVNSQSLKVQRGILGSTIAEHTNTTAIKKSINTGIMQSIDKTRLKKGQEYRLTFYAKDENQSAPDLGYGNLAIEFNGGYINSSGDWVKASKDINNGYMSKRANISVEDRWIPFEQLEKPDSDTGARDNALDDIWRKFSIVIKPEFGKEFLTDMKITFASRGIDNSEVHIDLADLHENTKVFIDSSDSLFESNGFIYNEGSKDLVSFDSKESILKVIKNIFNDYYKINNPGSDYDISDTVSKNISSSQSSATMVSKNREVHIGYGGDKSDTSPHWLGYLNHQLFGEDYTGRLYLDEDTVHTYDEEGMGLMSKVCLAGEHERITVSWSSPNLTVTHNSHSMNIGDNIVIREWMDTDNSWDGNGVWVVKTIPDANSFTCVRATNYDKDPASGPSNNLVSYRPYFYYGIKDGEYSIYRIWPDAKLGGGGSGDDSLNALNTTYTKGKIEKSLPLAVPVTSIATCYNKDLTNGTEGGRIYVLSSISDEIYVYDVQKKWDEWETGELLQKSNIDLHFKSFKWSNHTTYGDISATKGVFGGLATETTPTIKYAGILSDIIETKGPTSDVSNLLDADEIANNGIALNNFDTRLWVQCRNTGQEGFSDGDRFLFCGKSETGNTNGPSVLYVGDRTPPTTTVMGCLTRYDSSGEKFRGGPGLNPQADLDAAHYEHLPSDVYADIANYSYFYHYYDDDDDKRKLSRLSVNSTWSKENNGHSGSIQSQYYDKPYINFGYNVGWNAENGMPSIKVAKYGMFQIADNDGDGLLDGTGVVVPNDDTITDATNLTGPYGRLHQRVCSHAVGLIGGAETNWQRHWGRLHARRNMGGDDYFISNHGSVQGGPTEDTPESMSVEKCVFISADMHYGDNQPDQTYDWTAKAAYDSGKQTTLTINAADKVENLEVGDMVLLKNQYESVIITDVDITNNKIRIAIPEAEVDNSTGTLYPHTMHYFAHNGDRYGLLDTEKMFHYSYDEDDGTNGDIFTDIPGSGHFTKTYFTPPSYWGGPKYGIYGTRWGDANQFSRNNTVNPGWVWPIEKLSFRGGMMIRPFDMEDEAFNDLIIGNGVYVDMPSFPNAVYHVNNSSKLIDDRGNSSPNNSFASKLFISCPRPQDTNQESNVYICDLNFMYPQQAIQIEEEQDNGDETTNSWNYGISWDICFSGTIGAYDTTNTNTDLEGNNSTQPTLTLDISTFEGNNTDIFTATESSSTGNSYYRMDNALYGLCISIMDAVTGTIQTRQIIGSKYDGSADMIVKIHYPFGHAPHAANDKFWVWKHSLVSTAPVRLMKTATLPHNLGNALDGDPILSGPIYKNTGSISDLDSSSTTATATTSDFHNLTTGDKVEITESTVDGYDGVYSITVTNPKEFTYTIVSDVNDNATATWTLLNNSSSSAANPLSVPLTRPLMSTHFGGLDMRKSRALNVVSSINDNHETVSGEVRAELTFTADTYKTGETVTLVNAASDTVFNGTYRLAKGSEATTGTGVDTTADIPHNSTAGNVTDDYNLTTNQWEMFIAGTSAKAQIGELRAGFTQWDKGNIASNISRYDSTSDGDRYMAYGESSVRITPVSLANQDGDFFLKNTSYYYKISYIYDGYQEGPLSDTFWVHNDTSSRAKLSISIDVKKYSKRLTHVCLYRKDGINAFYKLVKEIETKSSWNKVEGGYSYTFGDEGDVGASYEARTGLPEILDTIKIKYGMSVELDGYLFVADCNHEKVDNASNQLFRSKPGMFSIFNYIYDYAILKSKPTALAAFNGRLYVFDENNIYKVNPNSLVIEDTFEGVGCLNKDSVIVTEFGMFFADKTGAYMHTGQSPVKISEPIQKGGNTEETFGGTDNIRDVSWENVVTNAEGSKTKVIFDSQLNSVLFNVTYGDFENYNISSAQISNDLPTTKQYIWSFNIARKRWDLWELSEDSEIGSPFTGDRGEIYYPINNSVFELRGGSLNRDYTWISKKITLGEPSITKVFNKLKLNGITKDVNLNGSYIESSDRLLIVSSTGTLATGDITSSVQTSGDIDYKLSGSNKKGRWLQFKLENMTEAIDSIGILYRRKSTK